VGSGWANHMYDRETRGPAAVAPPPQPSRACPQPRGAPLEADILMLLYRWPHRGGRATTLDWPAPNWTRGARHRALNSPVPRKAPAATTPQLAPISGGAIHPAPHSAHPLSWELLDQHDMPCSRMPQLLDTT
jgi:hypothetical protein